MGSDAKAKKWFHAIQSGNLNEVEFLLSDCVGTCGDFGETGLQYAVQANNPQIVRLLINYEVGITNDEGCTALIMAALSNFAELCAILAPLEADIALPDGRNAYMLAAQVGSYDALVALHEYFTLTTDSHDLNALDYAAMTGNLNCVDEIVRKFNPSEQERNYSRTLAEAEGHQNVVKYFDTGVLVQESDAPVLSANTSAEQTSTFKARSIVIPAQGIQSPRPPNRKSLQARALVIEQERSAETESSNQRTKRTKDYLIDLASSTSDERNDPRVMILEPGYVGRKTSKETTHTKVDKKQKVLSKDGQDLILLEQQYNEVGDGFLTVNTQKLTKSTASRSEKKPEQRARSGMCGSKLSKKKGFTQSSSDFLPLLRQKDTEIRQLQSQLEALVTQRSTLFNSSFAMVDACVSTDDLEPVYATIDYGLLLKSKDNYSDRLVDLCSSTSQNGALEKVNVWAEITTPNILANLTNGLQENCPGTVTSSLVKGADYDLLLQEKDEEIMRLQTILYNTTAETTQDNRFSQLYKELEAKILRETEFIGLLDEVAQDLRSMKERIVLHKKAINDIQQQGFISGRRAERDIRLEDLFDKELRSYDVIREVKQQMIAYKAELSGYVGHVELIARALYNESNTNDLNKSLKRSASYCKSNCMSTTGKHPVPNPTNAMSVTLHPPTRSSSAATLQPLKPPQKLVDYSQLLRDKDAWIERLTTLLYTSPITFYTFHPLPSYYNRSTGITFQGEESFGKNYEDILVQKDQVINDLRRELEVLLKSSITEGAKTKKQHVTIKTEQTDMAVEDLMTSIRQTKIKTDSYTDAFAKLSLEHAAMQVEIDIMTKAIASKDNAIIFFADHFTRKSKKYTVSDEGVKQIKALELKNAALKSQLQAAVQETTSLKTELKALIDTKYRYPIQNDHSNMCESNIKTKVEASSSLKAPHPVIIPAVPPRNASLTLLKNTEMESSPLLRSASLLRQTISRAKSRTPAQAMRLMSQCTEKTGLTKLMLAVIDGDAYEIGLHLNLLCLVTDKGLSSLMYAAIYNRIFAVEYLIHGEAGLVDKDGKTALAYALEKGHIRIAELLTPYECPDVSNQDISHTGVRTTELMLAVVNNDLVRAWALLPMQHGVRNTNNKTALIISIELRRPAFVRILLPLEHMHYTVDGISPIDLIASLRGTEESILALKQIVKEYLNS